jgi:hypothetical protein
MIISTALVNCDFLGIKLETVKEEESRNQIKSHRNSTRIDGKILEDTRAKEKATWL